MKYTFETKNTCAKAIEFEIEEDKVMNVRFLGGGCLGNLQAIPKLVEGMKVDEVIAKLEGIRCGLKSTSCADQLVQGLKVAINNQNK